MGLEVGGLRASEVKGASQIVEQQGRALSVGQGTEALGAAAETGQRSHLHRGEGGGTTGPSYQRCQTDPPGALPRTQPAGRPLKRRQAIGACLPERPCWHGGRAAEEGCLATQRPEARPAGQDNATCRAELPTEPNGVVRPRVSSSG